MWGWGEHLAIQLSRLFCMPGGWVGACVPVAGGGRGAACVWAGAGGGLAMFAGGPCRRSGWHVVMFLFVYFGVPGYPCILVRGVRCLRLGHLVGGKGF